MIKEIEKIIVTEEQIQKKVAELAKKISEDYKDKDLLMVSILKGGFIFASDLCRKLSINASIDFMAVSSYGASSKSSGVVKILKDLDHSIEGKDVLIVEDILDSGVTLYYLRDLLMRRGVKSIRICTILNKPEGRRAPIDADYVGFDVPDGFVVGYGLDYNEKFRNLPYVGILKPEIYAKDE